MSYIYMKFCLAGILPSVTHLHILPLLLVFDHLHIIVFEILCYMPIEFHILQSASVLFLFG
jgi:hypothetical protein